MKKTLSEQICKICELEKIVVKHNPHTKKTTYTSLILDFEQPDNFIKLYEIMSEQTKEEILSRIVNRLLVESGDYINNKKQSIRDYDGWIWW